MKYILILSLLFTLNFGSFIQLSSFEADFKQTVTDDTSKKLTYSGHIQAKSPRYALWQYLQPINKNIYVLSDKIIIIEPEIEQVIIKKLSLNFDFFTMINSARKISKDKYTTNIDGIKYTIDVINNIVISISYKDNFDNKVEILFSKQVQNKTISKNIFTPLIPKGYDIIDE